MSTNKLIPELRFPEFANEGDWTKELLKDVTIELIDGDWIESKDQSKDGVRLIQTGNIGVGEFIPKPQNARFISEETFKKLKCNEVFPGDCLISRLPDPAGRSCFIPDLSKRMITSVDCLIVRFDSRKIVPQLFVSYSQTYKYLSTISEQTSGSTRERISKDNLSKIKIPITSLKEQQKIASCLSSLDEVIATHSKKLETLKDHKKGLIQNLFPQEGKTVPKLRFPEFANDGEWRKTTIEKIAKVSAGGTPESTNPEYWNGNIPWMNSGELNNKRIYSVSNFITLKGLKESSTKLIPTKCVLIGLAGQGKTRGTAAINYIELCTNQSIGSIHPNEDVFVSEFLYQKIDSMYEQLRYLSAGDGGRGGLNLQIIKEIELLVPKLKEQQKIASCLSSLDALIIAQAEKIEQLKLHKKGLMQSLFPKNID